MKKIYFISTLLVVLGFFAGGCSTMEGLGKDIQKLGNAIEGEAD